jgi:hypothetical protein
MEGCCSIGELSNLYSYDGKQTADSYKETMAGFICWYLSSDSEEYPRYFVAVTRDGTQDQAEIALKALGFKSKSITGRHLKFGLPHKYLKFWSRSCHPRGVLKQAKEKLLSGDY